MHCVEPVRRRTPAHAAFALLALLLPLTGVAQIHIVLVDSAGTGFRDGSAADPAAGDNGAGSLGEQRVRVLQRAAEIWNAQLSSAAPIRVAVRMPVQDCDEDGTTLGTAGPTFLATDFPNAPRPNTAYHIAQANALSGQDLRPGQNHINANFNLRIDEGCSAGIAGWWYGLDPDEPVPSDRFAMLPVALHELAHGLGFSANVELDSGAYFGGTPTAWSHYLYDLQAGKHWRSMSNAERFASARNDPHLVWSGEHTNGNLRLFLTGAPILRMLPARGPGDDVIELGLPVFGPGWPATPLSGQAILVNDGVGGTSGTLHDGCELPFVNGARLAGRIALIDRGSCNFTVKVRNAQSHGAIGAVIVDNQEGAPPGMAGIDPAIVIPSVAVSRQVGERMKRQLLRPQLRLSLTAAEELGGVNQGCLRMYAPADSESGSSISHFHRAAFPSLLMAPSISASLFDDVDLTLDLFRDLGWPLSIDEPPPASSGCVVGPASP